MTPYLRSLLRRYEAGHLCLDWPPAPILDGSGEQMGYLDRIEMQRGALLVSGWALADEVTLLVAGQSLSTVPRQRREDVARLLGLSPDVGFRLSLPCDIDVLRAGDTPGITIRRNYGPPVPPISLHLAAPRLRAEQRRVRRAFLRDSLRAAPSVVGWIATRDPCHRAAVKRILRLDRIRLPSKLDDRLFREPLQRPEATRCDHVTIVLPVFNAFELLPEVLDRVERNTDCPWQLIVVEDCSTDMRVRPFLRDWARQRADHVRLLENDENLGFVGSVNRGLSVALSDQGQDGPVVLLNSDALLPPAWAERLLRPLAERQEAASATPMSNDAELLSVPAICEATQLGAGQAAAIDARAQELGLASAPVDVPTGVGFCMALDRAWLSRFPDFDTTFGRGYGEEVDWCQKLVRQGAVHLAVPNLFVEHRGGSSFGSMEKAERLARNNAIISSRYPEFDKDVQSFVATDPLRSSRLALGLAWAGSLGQPIPIYLGHSLGGGAETYLERRIAADLAKGKSAVVLRVGGSLRWQVELHAPGGVVSGATQDDALVEQLLEPVPARHVVYSCGVGDTDPVSLPRFLAGLRRGESDFLEMLFHDYFPISPSYTLLDSDGVYRGPVTADRHDRAHLARGTDGRRIALAEWQDAWGALARCANELRVFAADGARHVAAVWPDVENRIAIVPHSMPSHLPRLEPAPGSTASPVIGVLGNIGFQKGAALLQRLASVLAARQGGEDAIGLAVVGNIDPAYPLPDWVPVTGDYRLADIARLANRHKVTHWLIPSIWPETFSYTTREALATGLPVLAFDIGAQGEAVREAPNGHPLLFESGDDRARVVLSGLETLLRAHAQ